MKSKNGGGQRTAKNKHRDSAPKKVQSRHFSSRITAGLSLLPSIDGRSGPARVFKSTYEALVEHCGGEDHVPETKRLMCRHAAALHSELVNLQCSNAALRASGSEPKPETLDLQSRLTNSLRRVLADLGWCRHMRDVTPSLSEYVEAKYGQVEDAA